MWTLKIEMNEKKQNKTHRCREQTGGLTEGNVEMGKIGEED